MVLKLGEIVFDYDFFTTSMPNGGYLVMNKIKESMKHEASTLELDRVNIAVYLENEIVSCSSVIGMSNDYLGISTDHKELEGKTLSSENMQYCVMELYE